MVMEDKMMGTMSSNFVHGVQENATMRLIMAGQNVKAATQNHPALSSGKMCLHSSVDCTMLVSFSFSGRTPDPRPPTATAGSRVPNVCLL